jgi:hypothetical protein
MRQEEWFIFQEEICDYFLSIGARAETNIRVQGVRTCHDVDVLVQTKFLGEELKWIVEAKHWNSKISKNHVLALRTIADDVGADRAFIISLKGFQTGAVEATKNTNITLKTFDELKKETKELVESEILKTYDKRLQLVEDRYWAHSKKIRKKYGLRNEMMDFSMTFSGQILLGVARKAILAATDRKYPIDVMTFHKEHQGDMFADNFQQLQNWFNLNLNHFEEKLLTAEWEMQKNGEYTPDGSLTKADDISPAKMMGQGMYQAEKNG